MHKTYPKNARILNSNSQPEWFALSSEIFELGESPRWAHQQLRWVDITQKRMYVAYNVLDSLKNKTTVNYETVELEDQIACLIPTPKPHVWLGFGRQGIWKLYDNTSPELFIPAPFSSDKQRFNDGCVDQWGRVWITSLCDEKSKTDAALYCFEKNQLHCIYQNLTTGNGTAYNPHQKTLWFADTKTKMLFKGFIHADSTQLDEITIQHQYNTTNQRPDGALMTRDGTYLVAILDGYRLDIFNSTTGELLTHITTPFTKITMPCIVSTHQDCLNNWLICTSANSHECTLTYNQKKIYSGQLIACSTTIKAGFNFYYDL